MKLPTAHFIDARRRARKMLGLLSGEAPTGYSTEWLIQLASKLWQAREVLADDILTLKFELG